MWSTILICSEQQKTDDDAVAKAARAEKKEADDRNEDVAVNAVHLNEVQNVWSDIMQNFGCIKNLGGVEFTTQNHIQLLD